MLLFGVGVVALQKSRLERPESGRCLFVAFGRSFSSPWTPYFIGVIQVLRLRRAAVMVLFLFIIMLLNLRDEQRRGD